MEQRNEYIKKLEENIAVYDRKIDEMKAKATGIKADLKAEYLVRLNCIENKRDNFVVKCEELKDAKDQGWDDVKSGTDRARNELEHSFGRALSRFR